MPMSRDEMELRVLRNSADIDDIYEMLTEILARLDAHDARFDAIDIRFDGIEARLDGVDARFDGVDATLAEILRRLPEPPAAA